MRVCNRKLAKRIKENRVHNDVLTQRFLSGSVDLDLFKNERTEILTDILRDIQTLEEHGYNEKGQKL